MEGIDNLAMSNRQIQKDKLGKANQTVYWTFVRFEVRRRKWLLPPFVRMSLPEPVRRNRLDVALWVLSLVLPALALRGTAAYSFQTKLTAEKNFSRGY